MSKYVKSCVLIVLAEILILVAANFYYVINNKANDDREYRVASKRIEDRLRAGEDCSDIDLSSYRDIVEVGRYDPGMYIPDDYLIISVPKNEGFYLYYLTYRTNGNSNRPLVWIDVICGVIIICSLIAFAYIGRVIIKPFDRIRELPYELSKGNLTVPVKEEKNKVFGRFLWGMDLLRENLEDSKEEELRLQKEKKTLLLSISHDIKTPLSSIKLYTKALEENLYEGEDKKKDVYKGIENNAREIENYVNEIIKASKEDFLNLQVKADNFYLKDVIESVDGLYRDKLEPIKTKWIVESYDNCILSGDKERLIEVLQNIIENAIKYGDGGYIRLSVSEEEDCKLISVENSGEEIKPEELPHVFDSFYRGSNVSSKKGSGLGLYICRTLMRMMDGDVYGQTSTGANTFTVVVRKA